MLDLNELASVAALTGGIGELANLLGVDAELLDYALTGGELSRRQQALLEIAYGNLKLGDDLEDFYGVSFDEVLDVTDALDINTKFISDKELGDMYRFHFADGKITVDNLDKYGIWANLQPLQAERVIKWFDLVDDVQGFFDAYIASEAFWDIDSSTFWKWFRATFYSDDE